MSPCISSSARNRHSASKPRAGFALLITITLLAFLVLLLVSLASLTRVETQVASNTQQTAQARQNALLALQIAVGQLQKYAGPDQRTTARADINTDVFIPDETDPSKLHPNTRMNSRWTGVYGNRAQMSYADDPNTIAGKIAAAYPTSGAESVNVTGSLPRKGSQAILLNWLVSGNESIPGFNPALAPSGDVRADGGINRAETPVTASSAYHKPTDTPFSHPTLPPIVSPSSSHAHVLLVGPASIFIDPDEPNDPVKSALSDRVSAPLVNVSVSESSLPGFDPASTAQRAVGRYAWWVGDEGAKAHVNLAPDPATAQLPPANPDLAFVTAQRTAIELVDKTNPVGSSATFNTSDLVGSAYGPTGTAINKLLAPRQLSTLDASVWDTARKLRFHDLTGVSNSLLTDTYAGGLKKDLSSILSINGASYSGHADDDLIYVSHGGTGTTAATNPNAVYGLPTWGKLRSFSQTTTDASTPLTPRIPTKTDVGVYPVMTYSDVQLAYITNSGNIALAVTPRVVLWNPYTHPIAAARYEFGFTVGLGAVQLMRRQSNQTDWHTVDGPRRISWGGADSDPGTPTPRFMRFIIVTPEIPPGASYLFGRVGSAQIYDVNASYNSPPAATTELRRTNNPRHFIIPTGVASGPPEGAGYSYHWRVKASARAPHTEPSRDPAFVPPYGSALNSFLDFDFSGLIYAYLGQDPALQSPYQSQSAIWPPDASTTNRWYQASMGEGQSSSYGVTLVDPASGSTQQAPPSHAYLQTDPDRYNADPQYNINNPNPGVTLYSAPITADAWGGIISHSFDGIRRLVHSNPRASYILGSRAVAGLYASGYGSGSDRLENRDGFNLSSARSFNAVNGTVENSILFEFRHQDQPLMSIGQLQHANLSYGMGSPAYLIGNGHAPVNLMVDPALYPEPGYDPDRPRVIFFDYGTLDLNEKSLRAGRGYDAAYLANRALWDRYFVSTVPHDGTTAAGVSAIPPRLPNARHLRPWSGQSGEEADLLDANKAASRLLLAGGFNINSTSEQAWRAILGGINQLNHHTGATIDQPAHAALSRFSIPPSRVPRVSTRADWAHTGYRTLSPMQIDALAKAIVFQIRNRGPFVSLGDFINRRLRDNPDTTAANVLNPGAGPTPNYTESLKGVLQEAIDSTPNSGPASINNQYGNLPFTTATGGNVINITAKQYNSPLGSREDPYSARGGPWERLSTDRRFPEGAVAANAPQFLTQADVLSTIGAGLSARSDTFVVRTYGDVVNPTTGDVTSRAWCEAVVQRTIDYVGAEASDLSPSDPSLSASSQSFGRRFTITSFRWLSPSDI